MKSDVATDLIRHVIDSIIDNISNKIVDANINITMVADCTGYPPQKNHTFTVSSGISQQMMTTFY